MKIQYGCQIQPTAARANLGGVGKPRPGWVVVSRTDGLAHWAAPAGCACSQRLARTALASLLRFEFSAPAPDGTSSKLHVFADLADAQAVDCDHLRILQLASKVFRGFLGVHFFRHLGLKKPLVVSF